MHGTADSSRCCSTTTGTIGLTCAVIIPVALPESASTVCRGTCRLLCSRDKEDSVARGKMRVGILLRRLQASGHERTIDNLEQLVNSRHVDPILEPDKLLEDAPGDVLLEDPPGIAATHNHGPLIGQDGTETVFTTGDSSTGPRWSGRSTCDHVRPLNPTDRRLHHTHKSPNR